MTVIEKKKEAQCRWCNQTKLVFKSNLRRLHTAYSCAKCSRLLNKKQNWAENDISFWLTNRFITWANYQKYQPRSHKIRVCLQCSRCGARALCSSKNLSRRTPGLGPVCNQCILSVVTSTNIWRKHNSIAQLKIQSTDKQKLKNAKGVARFWRENPERKEQVRRKILLNYADPGFKARWLGSLSKQTWALSGELMFRGAWVEFGSSYELCFLLWIEPQSDKFPILRRCKYYIPYFYGGRPRHYNPDYLLINGTGERILVEIKSTQSRYYDPHIQKAKLTAVTDFLEQASIDRYWFIDELEAKQLGIILKRSKKIHFLCKSLHNQEKIRLFSVEKTRKYIGLV